MVDLNVVLFALVVVLGVFSLFLIRMIQRMKEEHRRMMIEHEADSRVLFLKSRYASMGETIGNIAHQWKQPLNAIGTIQNNIKAAVLFQGGISQEKLLHSVESSFRLIRHLAETIDTFYGFLVQHHEERCDFRISDELETIRKITEYSFQNSSIQLVYEIETNPFIHGNPNEFTHAMLNLILNAKDAFDRVQPDTPTITVRVDKGGEKHCLLSVCDNAGGIRFEPVDLIFDLHVTTKSEGSGLGLFMTKNIIEKRFGGTIKAQNEQGGACFRIELPYAGYREHLFVSGEDEERIALERVQMMSRKIAELEEARNVLAKWADIFKHARWGIAIHMGTGNRFEMTNPCFDRMYGYTQREIRNIGAEELFAHGASKFFSRMRQKAFEEGYVEFETFHRRKDGALFPVAVEIIVVKSDSGEILYHILNLRDITAQRKANERLLLKKFALDHIQDAVFLIDENSDFQYVNEGACRALGYTQDQFVKMRVGDVDPAFPPLRWAEHWNNLKQAGSMMIESRHRRNDGVFVPVEISANFIRFDGRDYNMAIARDITERKKAEETIVNLNATLEKRVEERTFELQQALEFNEGIIGAIPDLLFEITPEGVYIGIWAQNEELLVAQKAVLLGKNFKEVLPPDVVITSLQTMKEVDEKGFSLGNTYRLDLPEGTRWFELSVTKKKSSGNYIVLARDITERKKIEKQLMRSETNLKEAQKLTKVGSWELEIQKNALLWSDETYRIFEIDQEQSRSLHKIFYESIHPDDVETVRELYEESLKTKCSFEMDHRIVMSDGRIKHVIEKCETTYADDGTPLYSIGTVQDITERKKAEEALQSNRNLLHAILESSPGVITFALDKNYRYIAYDSKHEEVMRTIFGKKIAIGMNMLEVIGSDTDRNIAKRSFDRALRDESFIAEEEYGDERLSRKYWQIFYSPIRSETGEVIGLTCFNMDITERRRAEEKIQNLNTTLEKRVIERTAQLQEAIDALHGEINERKETEKALAESEQRYKEIFENTSDSIYLMEVTEDGRFRNLTANPAFIRSIGIPLEMLAGSYVGDLTDEETTATVIAKYRRCIEAGVPTEEIAELDLPVGRKTFCSTLIPIKDESGRVCRIIGLAKDITEIRQ